MRSFVISIGVFCSALTAHAQTSENLETAHSSELNSLSLVSKSANGVQHSKRGTVGGNVSVNAQPRWANDLSGDILDVVKGDWNSDGDEDFAVLTRSNEEGVVGSTANLSIYERYPEAQVKHAMTVENFFLAWGHSHLTRTSETSFEVGYGNINGRGNWRNELTIAFRDGQYVVAGYTSTKADGMAPENAVYCDVNLLTGQYEVVWGAQTENAEVKMGKAAPEWFALKDLADHVDEWDQYTPAACKERVGAY